MATIGRAAAVADLRWVKLSGYVAWLVWLFVHLMYIVQFANRLLVFLQWAYNYLTRNRPARLITEFGPGAPVGSTVPAQGTGSVRFEGQREPTAVAPETAAGADAVTARGDPQANTGVSTSAGASASRDPEREP